jgi:hypothetical protein
MEKNSSEDNLLRYHELAPHEIIFEMHESQLTSPYGNKNYNRMKSSETLDKEKYLIDSEININELPKNIKTPTKPEYIPFTDEEAEMFMEEHEEFMNYLADREERRSVSLSYPC